MLVAFQVGQQALLVGLLEGTRHDLSLYQVVAEALLPGGLGFDGQHLQALTGFCQRALVGVDQTGDVIRVLNGGQVRQPAVRQVHCQAGLRLFTGRNAGPQPLRCQLQRIQPAVT